MSNELELNKDRADAGRYYKLFAGKVGKFEDGERILFIHIDRTLSEEEARGEFAVTYVEKLLSVG